jgi:hypothetical protein
MSDVFMIKVEEAAARLGGEVDRGIWPGIKTSDGWIYRACDHGRWTAVHFEKGMVGLAYNPEMARIVAENGAVIRSREGG